MHPCRDRHWLQQTTFLAAPLDAGRVVDQELHPPAAGQSWRPSWSDPGRQPGVVPDQHDDPPRSPARASLGPKPSLPSNPPWLTCSTRPGRRRWRNCKRHSALLQQHSRALRHDFAPVGCCWITTPPACPSAGGPKAANGATSATSQHLGPPTRALGRPTYHETLASYLYPAACSPAAPWWPPLQDLAQRLPLTPPSASAPSCAAIGGIGSDANVNWLLATTTHPDKGLQPQPGRSAGPPPGRERLAA